MGLVNNINGLKQPMLFDGLERLSPNGFAMYPSDIDLLYDHRGAAWFAAEIKQVGAPLKTGQRILIERLHTALSSTAPTLTVLARHTVTPPKPVVVAALPVDAEMRGECVWLYLPSADKPTLGEAFEEWLEAHK